jgi:sulfite reductase (NADPH) hemoprotein beta-component
LRQWSTFHPELCFLPRKFKVAITGTPEDRALVQIHDMAFEVVEATPHAVFRVRVGGGLGRTPILGPVLRERLDWYDMLTYTHAVMRVYNELGRRDNLTKARIKILVRSVGIETFSQMVEAEWQDLRDGPHKLTQAELDRVTHAFVEPDWTQGQALTTPEPSSTSTHTTTWLRWLKRNRLAHRHPGYAAILIPLKAPGRAPGDVTSDEIDALATIADRFSQGFIRVSHTQDFVLPAVREADMPELYQALQALNLHHAVGGLLGSMVVCPGGDFCALANARSLPIAEDIAQRYAALDAQEAIGPLDLRISGCMNSCGHHHVGHIGILGVDKDGAAFYQLLLGGHSGHGAPAALGTIIGRAFAENEIADAVEEIIDAYLEQREPGETFRQSVARLGKPLFALAAEAARKPEHQPKRHGSQLQDETLV